MLNVVQASPTVTVVDEAGLVNHSGIGVIVFDRSQVIRLSKSYLSVCVQHSCEVLLVREAHTILVFKPFQTCSNPTQSHVKLLFVVATTSNLNRITYSFTSSTIPDKMKMVTVQTNTPNKHSASFRTKSIELFDRVLRRDGGLLVLLTLLAMPLLFSQLFLSTDDSNRVLTETTADRPMMNVADVNSHINMTALLERDPVDNIRSYDLDDLLRVIPYYDHAMALLIYDPIDDRFFAYYSTNHRWKRGCEELIVSIRMIVYILRRLFPQRFTPTSPEFAMVISAGDVPGVRETSCVKKKDYPCSPMDLPPILHFGHVFQLPLFPSMIGKSCLVAQRIQFGLFLC